MTTEKQVSLVWFKKWGFGSFGCISSAAYLRLAVEASSSILSMLVEGATSTTVEASAEARASGAVAVGGNLVEALVGAVTIAVPEALHVVVTVGAVESSAALVEARLAAVEAVLVAASLVAVAAAKADAAFHVFLLLLSGLLLSGLLLSVGQSSHSHKGGEYELRVSKESQKHYFGGRISCYAALALSFSTKQGRPFNGVR